MEQETLVQKKMPTTKTHKEPQVCVWYSRSHSKKRHIGPLVHDMNIFVALEIKKYPLGWGEAPIS